MSRLASAIKAASTDALLVANLESMTSDMSNEIVSMEQYLDDLDDMVNLANGLETTVITLESLSAPSFAQQNSMRSQAVGFLKMSGLSDLEVTEIFPSLESKNPNAAWEKFKAFLVKLWSFIVETAKKVYQFIDNVIKKSSLAEKAAMMQLRKLRAESVARRNGLTIDPQIKLRPAHRYLLPPGESSIRDMSQLTATLRDYRQARDMIQVKMPEILLNVAKELIVAIDGLALSGTDDEVSLSIANSDAAIRKAVEPMFPRGLQAALGAPDLRIPLIYDREIVILEPSANMETDLKDYLGQLGVSIDQATHPANPESLGTFPALRTNDIDRLLSLAAELIDEGHSADQQRKWQRLKGISISLGLDIDSALKTILRKQGLTPEARDTLKLALNARQAMSKWISAPFMQLNTVNIRVVESVLSLAADQIKNYELKDSVQERVDRKNKEEADKSKSKPAQGKATQVKP